MRLTPLHEQQCLNPEQGLHRLPEEEITALLLQVHNWEYDIDSHTLSKRFKFDNYYQTIAFVNALAWIAHTEDHHPGLEVDYNHCIVHFTTHSVEGLSINDFICAAKIDMLHSPRT
jgi:4a-hydroxytetrahydrobiopterin dehydratase